MRAVVFTLLGATMFAAMAFCVAVGVSQYQVQVLHYSPAKADVFIDAFLYAWPAVAVLGGFVGYRLRRWKRQI